MLNNAIFFMFSCLLLPNLDTCPPEITYGTDTPARILPLHLSNLKHEMRSFSLTNKLILRLWALHITVLHMYQEYDSHLFAVCNRKEWALMYHLLVFMIGVVYKILSLLLCLLKSNILTHMTSCYHKIAMKNTGIHLEMICTLSFHFTFHSRGKHSITFVVWSAEKTLLIIS